MSESQSFIETTLPPGYGGNSRCDGTMWSWYTVNATIYSYVGTEAERNRSAWRHWTATALRGRNVDWGDSESEGRWVAYGDDSLGPYAAKRRSGLIVLLNGDHNIILRDVDDPDEAMARFAALVVATEGMVPR
jgi:hypothetical protein